MGDRSGYSDDGLRGKDAREGFGDDMGTRVGRPDGARGAPRDAGSAGNRPGQAGTNDSAVADGIEGSILDRDAGQARGSQDRDPDSAGSEQSRVQAASEGVNRPAGDNRRIDDL
jgi:hypothetical protein